MMDLPAKWGPGQLLAFSGMDGATDYDSGLCLRTSGEYVFEVKLPEEAGTKVIYTGEKPDSLVLTGDFFQFRSAEKLSTGVLLDAYHLLLEGDFFICNAGDCETAVSGNRQLLASGGHLKKGCLAADIVECVRKRSAFLENAVLPQGLSENARRCAAKALSQLKTQICSPQGRLGHVWSTPDRWPHQMMWLWDSVFHALGLRHFDVGLARSILTAVFDMQREDGFIPHCGSPSTISQHSQAPVLGLGIKAINETAPDRQWVSEVAPKLKKFLLWLMANRDSDGAGLLEWHIGTEKTCRSGESGMDNSPRFDGAIQLDAPDFNAYLAGECEILAELLPEERDFWRGHHERLCSLMRQRLWSEEDGLFEDYDVVAGRRTGVISSAGFLPLYCGAATEEQAARMVEHLTNPKTFGTPLRIPSIAASNVAAYQKDMWRGPVWLNINYLVAMGLRRYGYHDLAVEILRESAGEIERCYLKYGTFFEFYDDRREMDPPELDRKGKVAPGPRDPYHQVIHDYGWTATLYLDILHQKGFC